MKELICKTCGGSMSVDSSGLKAVCNYCDTVYLLNHEDTDYYQSFFVRMGTFLSSSESEAIRRKKADELWENANVREFSTSEGVNIEVRYMYRRTEKKADVYVTRKNIVYHFHNDGIRLSNAFRRNVSMLDYPTADTRKLSDHFPKISGGYVLADGSSLLILKKDEDEYPLRLFGVLDGRHTAWIISRLENICCVLEYNGIVHPEITLDTLYINPYTHQASLYGNWWSVTRNNSFSEEIYKILTTADNLKALRDVAAKLSGYSCTDDVKLGEKLPDALVAFLKEPPCDNAYDDFSKWDDYMLKAYGERKFIDMKTDDGKIYK